MEPLLAGSEKFTRVPSIEMFMPPPGVTLLSFETMLHDTCTSWPAAAGLGAAVIAVVVSAGGGGGKEAWAGVGGSRPASSAVVRVTEIAARRRERNRPDGKRSAEAVLPTRNPQICPT